MNPYFAHSRPDGDSRPWQLLGEHLDAVGRLAKLFAPEPYKDLAQVAGRWHDSGKYQAAFQRYIGVQPEASNEFTPIAGSVPHSGAGAALALERFGSDDLRFLLLALVIEAHHGALKPSRMIEDTVKQRGNPLLAAARANGLPAECEDQRPAPIRSASALGARMLFSALVDADLLDTEAWDRGYGRPVRDAALHGLAERIAYACEERNVVAQHGAGTEEERNLTELRRQVYSACIDAASQAPGVFTLTVPTGGGKTLSGLAFALRHAVLHRKQRVIVVAPYTSILEQTARVYRDVLGSEHVVEHHSNIAPEQDTDRNRQACENWDAPVIVTTSVQFFESLHAAHKRDCRKLHRIANSVVLLDEVQTFPVELLKPIHAALKRLVENFGVTVVHGTATQPLLASTKSVLPRDFQMQMTEIVPEPARLFDVVRRRFRVERLGDLNTPMPIEELADHVLPHGTALAITHRRRDAAQLAELLGPECLHLSAAMCAEHRTVVLGEARQRLGVGAPCLLVATQLIEAGVDIDFPVVFRAMAGLETLAQAAGRCNRELRLPQPGLFVVYRAGQRMPDGSVKESQPPYGSPRLGMQVALTEFEDGDPDLNDPQLFPRYARRVFEKQNTDRNGILDLEDAWDFPEVENKFRMVDEDTISVVAPYGHAADLVIAVRREGPTREGFRALQRFTVGLRRPHFDRLYAGGWLEPVLAGYGKPERKDALWAVREGMSSVYHPRFGFQTGESALEPLIA